MVTDRKKDNAKTPVKQGAEEVALEPNKINAFTPYDFAGKNLTPYGGLLPVITMLEKLGFQAMVERQWHPREFLAPWTCTGSCWESFWASTSRGQALYPRLVEWRSRAWRFRVARWFWSFSFAYVLCLQAAKFARVDIAVATLAREATVTRPVSENYFAVM
jgi:hypothetical protein